MSRPRMAATRSLSATASIPSRRSLGSSSIGGPPPPHATTMWPAEARWRTLSPSPLAPLGGRDLVARQLVAHLGPVSVNQRDPPAVPGQVHDRRQALARMAELIRDRGALARWRDGVPTQRDDDGAWHHGAAT